MLVLVNGFDQNLFRSSRIYIYIFKENNFLTDRMWILVFAMFSCSSRVSLVAGKWILTRKMRPRRLYLNIWDCSIWIWQAISLRRWSSIASWKKKHLVKSIWMPQWWICMRVITNFILSYSMFLLIATGFSANGEFSVIDLVREYVAVYADDMVYLSKILNSKILFNALSCNIRNWSENVQKCSRYVTKISFYEFCLLWRWPFISILFSSVRITKQHPASQINDNRSLK